MTSSSRDLHQGRGRKRGRVQSREQGEDLRNGHHRPGHDCATVLYLTESGLFLSQRSRPGGTQGDAQTQVLRFQDDNTRRDAAPSPPTWTAGSSRVSNLINSPGRGAPGSDSSVSLSQGSPPCLSRQIFSANLENRNTVRSTAA